MYKFLRSCGVSLRERREGPESRALDHWSPGKDHKAQSDRKQSDMNMLEDTGEGFTKAR